MEEPRIGVYICQCGVNIADVVDVQAVVEMAAAMPGVAETLRSIASPRREICASSPSAQPMR